MTRPILPRKFRAKTPVELLAKIYAAHGWVRKSGESRTARVGSLYDICLNHKAGVFVATPKEASE